MLNDASRRKFDVVMACDRLGRSLIDLLHTIQTLRACGVDVYLDKQSIDTTMCLMAGVAIEAAKKNQNAKATEALRQPQVSD